MHGKPSSQHAARPSVDSSTIATNFCVRSVEDALDCLDLIRPPDFQVGVLMTLLDGAHRPIAGIAIESAPSNELHVVAESIVRSLRSPQANPAVHAAVLAIVRNDHPTSGEGKREVRPDETPLLYLNPDELHSWRESQHLFAAQGIELLYLVVLEPMGWASLPGS